MADDGRADGDDDDGDEGHDRHGNYDGDGGGDFWNYIGVPKVFASSCDWHV